MKHLVSARVNVTVDITVQNENWNKHSDIEQVHREAKEAAVKRITELCQRYVRLVEVPRVEVVMSVREDR